MTKFTKEQLQQIVETDHVQCGDAAAMTRQLLAGLEQEPVYQACKEAGVWVDVEPGEVFALRANGEQVRALYAAPQLPQPAVPDYDALRLAFEATERKSEYGFNLHKYGIGYADEATQLRWEQWVACRAAMLQGKSVKQPSSIKTSDCAGKGEDIKQASSNEPVSQRDEFPEGWVAVPVDMTPEQMRAVQLNSELGAYAASNLTGAYSLFREFWDVAVKSVPNQEAE